MSIYWQKEIKSNTSTQAIKNVINDNFTFSDLSKRFENVDSSTGNIYCPFHDNHDTPAAKMYWNEEKEIWVIHCFGECHRNFTAYDYVDLILCKKYRKYSSPLHFLKVNMPEHQMNFQLEIAQNQVNAMQASSFDKKRNYIDNLYIETGNITDFIERLYTA